ncbi:MAG TPA: DUF3575 domain-containing protein [Bacteroidia bacterium]|nr:DUF3575 domain-containing protein [Bacteroidia bacterium]HRS57867.1 DUF3575 domain-containing protein [Bacteroidia bacterium]HRU67793.1 DUF3575 domain-containing protein [Bacteroidia bacterium]
MKRFIRKAKVIIILIFITNLSFGQDYLVKAFSFPFLSYYQDCFILSLGFEKKISDNLFFELTSNYQNYGTIESDHIAYTIYPGLKYLFKSERKFVNNCWSSIYLKAELVKNSSGPEEYYSYKGLGKGIGIAFGKLKMFKKRNSWFINYGIGVSYSYCTYLDYYEEKTDWNTGQIIINRDLPLPFFRWSLRPVFQIGYAFKIN